ncbi:thiamine pyrophosphate-dependent enzyme [Sphaerisporangium krabiense]|uniref:thiamine pyrophosphate-dependent enzyme n=1 Tax=Sphaerisporangium krabiense TaxID=763782 RepID=UPI001EF16ECF|nr:thiamine pyrophosphate-dependent enzyme [Sphaerisporangium krabiense]
MPESHRLCLGATLHLETVRHWLATCDVVLAIGTELGPADLWEERFALTGTLIRVDVDPAQMYGDHVADVAIVADAALAVQGLGDHLRDVAGPASREGPGCDYRAEQEKLTGRWTGYLRALGQALPEDAIIVGDNSMVVYHGALVGMVIDPPGRFLFPAGFGTLGFALPAGIGAKLGRPDRPVAVLAGDGALQFSLQELAMAVELGLSLPVIVALNGGFGEIREEMVRKGMRPVAVDLHGPDFPVLAEAYGAHGRAVKSPEGLREAVEEALRTPVPTVITFTEPCGDDGPE